MQITCAEGRTVEQKKALYSGIVYHLSRDVDVRREDVIINLVETKRANWSFGNGLRSSRPQRTETQWLFVIYRN